ncbi:MAG: YndJ family transporter [Ktedonobacterales bacterium]
MSLTSSDLTWWNRSSIGLGACAWALLAVINFFGWVQLTALDLIILLALWVITPLAVPLAATPTPQHDWLRGWQRLIVILQPFAALIGGVTVLLSTGPIAAAAATGWLLFTCLIAVQGVGRLGSVREATVADICLAVALIYLPIGGAWLVVARLGLQPLGFSPDIVLLTAIHFHYIPLAALVMTGLIGQTGFAIKTAVPWRLYQVAAIGLLLEPLLVAAGRTLAQLTGNQDLVSAATVLLALSLMLIAVLSLWFIIPATSSRVAQGLLFVSGTAVFFTMLAAGAYAVGAVTGAWMITISQMIVVHGWINALVLSLCGLLGWRIRVGQREG